MLTVINPSETALPLQSVVQALYGALEPAAILARITGPAQSVVARAGVTDTATGEPAGALQQFEVASQTKMMTAVMVLQLVAEGKLDLDATAGSYLDHATKAGIGNVDAASLRSLLNMTSGVPNYSDVPGPTPDVPALVQALLDNPTAHFGADDSLDLVRGLPPDFQPGQAYAYSNTNYTLLGKVIEAVTGMSFEENLQTRIFDPAGMSRSTTELEPPTPDRLHQYATLPDGTVLDVTDTRWHSGADGGDVSTTGDMTRFLRALLVDKILLGPDELSEMTERNNVETPDGGGSAWFGLGIVTVAINGTTLLGYTGGSFGTDSSTYLDTATGRIVSVAVTGPGCSQIGRAHV